MSAVSAEMLFSANKNRRNTIIDSGAVAIARSRGYQCEEANKDRQCVPLDILNAELSVRG